MKHLKYIHELINESVESYKWNLIDDGNRIVKYKFIDINNNEYLVEFKPLSKYNYELKYYVLDGEDYNVSKIVNSNPFKLLKTIFDEILNHFIDNNNARKVTLEGLPKEQENEYLSQRTKMYTRYLERNPISNYKLTQIGNRINLTKI